MKISLKKANEIQQAINDATDSVDNLIEILESPGDYEPSDREDAKIDLEANLEVLHNLHLSIKDK